MFKVLLLLRLDVNALVHELVWNILFRFWFSFHQMPLLLSHDVITPDNET